MELSEQFVPIKDYEGLYEISNLGNVNRIMKTKKRKPVKINKNSAGLLFFFLSKQGKKNSFSLSKSVFKHFAPRELFKDGKDYDLVFTDDDKTNCKFSNLTWFEKSPKGITDYNLMTDCEKFAKDTKYVHYLENHWGHDYYVFKRIVNHKLYREMWNIGTINEDLDYLKCIYKNFMKQFN